MDELFGIVNVPSGVWINEQGIIVRPPETAYPRRPPFLDRPIPANATAEQIARITAVKALRIDAETYVAALHDWVRHGAASQFALSPDEVLRRSQPRPMEEATAAAHFELGSAPSSSQVARRMPSPTSAPRTACNRRTGHTSGRHGASLTRRKARMPSTRATGSRMCRRSAPENYYPPLDMEQ